MAPLTWDIDPAQRHGEPQSPAHCSPFTWCCSEGAALQLAWAASRMTVCPLVIIPERTCDSITHPLRYYHIHEVIFMSEWNISLSMASFTGRHVSQRREERLQRRTLAVLKAQLLLWSPAWISVVRVQGTSQYFPFGRAEEPVKPYLDRETQNLSKPCG